MRRLIRSRLIWISTVCKRMSEFTWCPNLPDFTLSRKFCQRLSKFDNFFFLVLFFFSLACQWWPVIECWLGRGFFLFFRGSVPVLLRNPTFLWFLWAVTPLDSRKRRPTAWLFACRIIFHAFVGWQWLSGTVLDSRPRGRGFEPHRRNCVVSLSKNINPSLVLVQPRKITERLLMGRK